MHLQQIAIKKKKRIPVFNKTKFKTLNASLIQMSFKITKGTDFINRMLCTCYIHVECKNIVHYFMLSILKTKNKLILITFKKLVNNNNLGHLE